MFRGVPNSGQPLAVLTLPLSETQEWVVVSFSPTCGQPLGADRSDPILWRLDCRSCTGKPRPVRPGTPPRVRGPRQSFRPHGDFMEHPFVEGAAIEVPPEDRPAFVRFRQRDFRHGVKSAWTVLECWFDDRFEFFQDSVPMSFASTSKPQVVSHNLHSAQLSGMFVNEANARQASVPIWVRGIISRPNDYSSR